MVTTMNHSSFSISFDLGSVYTSSTGHRSKCKPFQNFDFFVKVCWNFGLYSCIGLLQTFFSEIKKKEIKEENVDRNV